MPRVGRGIRARALPGELHEVRAPGIEHFGQLTRIPYVHPQTVVCFA